MRAPVVKGVAQLKREAGADRTDNVRCAALLAFLEILGQWAGGQRSHAWEDVRTQVPCLKSGESVGEERVLTNGRGKREQPAQMMHERQPLCFAR